MADFTVKQLATAMVKAGASDLYITCDLPPSCRVKGQIVPMAKESLNNAQCERLANSAMSERQKHEFAESAEMNLSLHYEGVGRFRVNIFRQKGALGMVIRHINTEIPTLDGLKLPEIFKEIILAKRGLLLMVGATGSGKSTSLAAMINHRNENEAGHIITIEDPLEYVHQHKKGVITQREVGTDTFAFKSALKSTLRQDPDAILIGEIRDMETMEFGLEFAETGHLCMATLHANNANQTLERIMNFFPRDMEEQVKSNLALNIKAILSQRLVKTVDGGRIPAIEILVNTPRIADLIQKWDIDAIKEAMKQGAQYGMQTFDQHLFQLWKDGIIDEREALGHADALNDLRLRMKMDKVEGNEEGGASGFESETALELSK